MGFGAPWGLSFAQLKSSFGIQVEQQIRGKLQPF